MKKARPRALRVVSVAGPTPPKPKLPPYPKNMRVNFWHPEHGMYQGKIIAADGDKDKYVVELRSGARWDVMGEWIKTRRPEDAN